MTKPTREQRIEAVKKAYRSWFSNNRYTSVYEELIDADPATAYIGELERQLADAQAAIVGIHHEFVGCQADPPCSDRCHRYDENGEGCGELRSAHRQEIEHEFVECQGCCNPPTGLCHHFVPVDDPEDPWDGYCQEPRSAHRQEKEVRDGE